MAESRDVDSGPCKKGRTTMKNSDVDSPLKLGKQDRRRTQGRNDQSRSDVMENSESRPRRRKSSKSDTNELVQSIMAEFEDENFLFELALSPSNFVNGMLTIPWRTAKKHFLFDHVIGTFWEIKLEFSDKKDRKQRTMKLSIPSQPGTQLFITGWGQFFGPNEEPDLIGFYKPALPLDNKHYLVDLTKGSYVFVKRLSSYDATTVLYIPSEASEKCFPPPQKGLGVINLNCSDSQNQAWKMTYGRYKGGFAITGGWRLSAKHHKLKANDTVIFSRVDHQQPTEDNKEYLI